MGLSYNKESDETFMQAVAALKEQGVYVSVTTSENSLGKITRSVELQWDTHNTDASLGKYRSAS